MTPAASTQAVPHAKRQLRHYNDTVISARATEAGFTPPTGTDTVDGAAGPPAMSVIEIDVSGLVIPAARSRSDDQQVAASSLARAPRQTRGASRSARSGSSASWPGSRAPPKWWLQGLIAR